jgi:hypothetical protein
MYIPGSRTLRAMAEKALGPAAALGRVSGASALWERLREKAIDAYLKTGDRSSPQGGWSDLVAALSEPSGYFFSENLVSNESDYAVAAPALERLPGGLAFLGVGPDPSLAYLAMLDCPLGFIVDVRRDNARLHCLYRAFFEQAHSRSEWLTMLLGRPFDPASDPGPNASIEDVLGHATSLGPSESAFRAAHERAMARLEQLPPFLLPGDRSAMARIHRSLYRRQLDITFQLSGPRLRRYPTLRDLLSARRPDGRAGGFLGIENAFRTVQRMQSSDRIVPIVGDLAGRRAVAGIGRELVSRGLKLGAIYVSNVEQYLFERGTWGRFVENLRALPCHEHAILIRSCFVDPSGVMPNLPTTLFGQIRRSAEVAVRTYRSPEQRPLHTMRTVVHPLHPFLEQERRVGYDRFRDLFGNEF